MTRKAPAALLLSALLLALPLFADSHGDEPCDQCECVEHHCEDCECDADDWRSQVTAPIHDHDSCRGCGGGDCHQ